MEPALGTPATDHRWMGPWLATHAPARLGIEPFTRAELHAWFRGGEVEADLCERLLACASAIRGGIDVALAEGLHALRKGNRLARLGFRFDDYAREVLDLGKRTAETLAHLGGELQSRPLLRTALVSGRLKLRPALTVLPVATGEAEPLWVERAQRQTVRELEDAVRRAKACPEDAEEEWLLLRTHLPPNEQTIVDIALEVGERVLPGSSRMERLEAMAQEYLGTFSQDGDADDTRRLGPAFRSLVPREGPRRPRGVPANERSGLLPELSGFAAPDVRFYETATPEAIDELLRTLARYRAEWDDLIGFCAHTIRRSGMHTLLGFASFRAYVEERLQLPARAVEQREALERRTRQSPALQDARRQGLSYEKRRVLSRLQDSEIGPWLPRARSMTCIALQRAVEGEKTRQMRARRTLVVPVARRVAVLLAAAVQTVRDRLGREVPTGTSLAIVAAHFAEGWFHALERRRTGAQRVRDRDLGWCQVPGCSHRATHTHHIKHRSQGGTDDPENLVGLCAFHHLRCIHGGSLKVYGRAPDALTWMLDGKPFTGGVAG